VSILGYGRTTIPYDMFDLARSAEDARRYAKCERIYHKGQELAWDGKEILPMLIRKHGPVRVEPEVKEALKRLFAIILWGELAAWKISAQLADRLVPLEAKMAATSQAHDEARHFYTMYDYLGELDYLPARLDPGPQALLDLVLETDDTVHKLLGMQLMIETIALAIFQEVRELKVEPVLAELLTYYERDEARHVGLGMQHLPHLVAGMGKGRSAALMVFQTRLIAFALWENWVLREDFAVLGIDPRRIVDRARAKQFVAVRDAYKVLGFDMERTQPFAVAAVNAAIEVAFPRAEHRGDRLGALRRAWAVLRRPEGGVPEDALDAHARHAIKTARGIVSPGDSGID
jgi:hypothetical protein